MAAVSYQDGNRKSGSNLLLLIKYKLTYYPTYEVVTPTKNGKLTIVIMPSPFRKLAKRNTVLVLTKQPASLYQGC